MRVAVWFIAAATMLPGARLAAQNRAQPATPRPLTEVTVEGTFQGAFPGNKLGINDDTDHPYWVYVSPQTKLSITGTAKPDYLRGGMLVSFTADLDKKGVVAEPVTELAIVPLESTKPGLFNEDRENKDSTRFIVRGILKTYKEGKLVVSAGGKQIQATLPDDVEIKFEGHDMSLVQTGDAITVTGGRIRAFNGVGGNMTPGEVQGYKIDVVLAEQLTAASHIKKKAPPKAAKPATPKLYGEGK